MLHRSFYVTFHIQKDRRINLGTCIHIFKTCPSLKSRTGITEIEGPIIQLIPKCNYCFEKLKRNLGK